MDLSAFKKLNIGGVELKKLTIDGALAWKSGYTNQVLQSLNADGTIYNGGLGYKNGYRVRSGGQESDSVYNNSCACTGFIPIKGGDTVRFSGWNMAYANNGNALNAYDAAHEHLGQWTQNPADYGIFDAAAAYAGYSFNSLVQEKTGVWKWIAPPAASGIAYIRVTGMDTSMTQIGAKMIITINEEIE